MNKSHDVYTYFEKLCSEILAESGYEIYGFNSLHTTAQKEKFEVDFFAKNIVGDFVVEVKFYRSERENAVLLNRAASMLLRKSLALNKKGKLLMVSCIVSPVIRRSIEEVYGVTIYDRNDILKLSIINAGLASQLDEILEPGKDEVKIEQASNISLDFNSISLEKIQKVNEEYSSEILNKSKRLKKDLEETPLGDGPSYEKICKEILRFIFEPQLSGWHSQLSTFDSLYRYDLVCRVKSDTDMWSFIINEMKSRYVVFEFKNYSDPIGQQQILTTEKYLSPKSFRSVAFIISRRNISKSAEMMCQGAMREHGKLIINLCDNDLVAMMNKKVEILEPSDYLFSLVDNFLLGLTR
ncbi:MULTISPECIES: hypothetical protein [Klebsiella pneumoniae complex]|uniref:hypothetical protein n=1 Tax=Klebsiella pneumoniae complex TaxID=3390273 RepID=UPI0010843917|nr:hypothetical protein [Klebsiella pneumoniae]MCQ8545330.1 hypothetical protein [Klebsiella pneumoniae]VAO80480.1 Uncharacterised protein [Klebsiella pneumoniae]VGJ15846.1 Uncharacterised protein [Klebsiella pneumoniae]